MNFLLPRVVPKIRKASDLSEQTKQSLFILLTRYYNGVSEKSFLDDLSEKSHVIVLYEAGSELIVGFSTLLSKSIDVNGKQVNVVYSGDTVLEKNYWGSSALGVSFLYYLFLIKLWNPRTPLYWMLISKGYKTYLKMANNFQVYYPRLNHPTPAFENEVMNLFYGSKFGSHYHSEKGLIIPGKDEMACKVKEGVAPIDDILIAKVPEVKFFADRNSGWKVGNELACIAKMELTMPLRYGFKKLFLKNPGAKNSDFYSKIRRRLGLPVNGLEVRGKI